MSRINRNPKRSGRVRQAEAALHCGMLAVIVLISGACRSPVPIRDVHGLVLSAPAGATVQDIDEAIWRAGRKLGWQVETEAPGRLVATLHLRRHVAVVAVTHDTRSVDIRYRRSLGLDYSPGQIHQNYNVWVARLADAIQAEPVYVTAPPGN